MKVARVLLTCVADPHSAELHDAKHQPDIKDGGSMGMPLDEFTEEVSIISRNHHFGKER